MNDLNDLGFKGKKEEEEEKKKEYDIAKCFNKNKNNNSNKMYLAKLNVLLYPLLINLKKKKKKDINWSPL